MILIKAEKIKTVNASKDSCESLGLIEFNQFQQCQTSICPNTTHINTKTPNKTISVTEAPAVAASSNLGDWSEFSECSASCGPAIRHRTRSCFGEHAFYLCQDGLVDIEECENVPCDLEFTYQDWANWAFCSKTCDLGERTRTRRCDDDQENCVDQVESEKCFYEPCVDKNLIHKDLCVPIDQYQTLDNCTISVMNDLDHLNGNMEVVLLQTVTLEYDLVYYGFNGTISVANETKHDLNDILANYNITLVSFDNQSDVHSQEINLFNETEITTIETLTIELEQTVSLNEALSDSIIDQYRSLVNEVIYTNAELATNETMGQEINVTYFDKEKIDFQFSLRKDPNEIPFIQCDIDSVSTLKF